MTPADRVLRIHLHPLFAGASDREVARAAEVTRAFTREERQTIDDERGMSLLLERAESVRHELGFEGDAVAFLDSLLDRARLAEAKRLVSVVQRARMRLRPPQSNGGSSRPPDQSRRASPTRNGDGGHREVPAVHTRSGLGVDR